MLPVEVYEILARMVETPKCYHTLALLCRNASIGCKLYMNAIMPQAYINVQVVYNFSGHNGSDWWHYDHLPFQVPCCEFHNVIERKHTGCTNNIDERCLRGHSYMSFSDDIIWDEPQEWELSKIY